jgi:hypothetical protein
VISGYRYSPAPTRRSNKLAQFAAPAQVSSWPHRDRCKYSDFAAAFGALRKRSDESSVPTAPLLTRNRHRAEAFQIEAQAGPGSGLPPAKMAQRVSLSEGEGLPPSLCSDEPRAERTDQRVRQRSTHRVRDFVFARFAERPVFARPNPWCMILIDREGHGVIEQTEARLWAAKMSPNWNSAAMRQ